MLTQSFRFFWERGTVTNKVESQLWVLPQMFTFLCEKRTGRIIQKIGRLVFCGEGNGGQFFRRFVCFWLVFLPGSFPCFYQFYLIFFFFFLFFVLFYLSMYLIVTCLVCLGALRPCTSKNLFLFFFVQSVSLSVS